MRFYETFGGMATNGCVDFYQLPPVQNNSIAERLEDKDEAPAALLPSNPTQDEIAKTRNSKKAEEMKAGCLLWRTHFKQVTELTINMRTKGVLKDILHGMRVGNISDASWRALQSRVLGVTFTDDGVLKPLPKGLDGRNRRFLRML